jgi:hypothetical protein
MPTYEIKAIGHMYDNIDVTIEAPDQIAADDVALEELKNVYPEYDDHEIIDVKEID